MQQFNPSVSLVRVLSMLLIIATHFLTWQKINSYQISTIGVASFLFISGYLYGEKQICDKFSWLLLRVKKILLPFWILVFTLSILLILEGYYKFAILQMFEALLNIQGIHSIIRFPFELGHNHLPCLGHCWFLTVIMLCYLLVLWVKESRVEYFVDQHPYVSLILAILLHVVFSFVNVAIGSLVIFFVGYFFKRKNLFPKYSRGSLICLFLVMSIAIVVRILLKRIIDGEAFYDLFIASISSNVCAISFFIVVYWLSSLSKFVADIPSKKWWRQIDSLTFPLYLTHYIFLKEPFDLKAYFPKINVSMQILMFLFFIFDNSDNFESYYKNGA